MSIVKEIDKLSGTNTRSRNITQAIDKLTGKGPSKNIGDAARKLETGSGESRRYSISTAIYDFQDTVTTMTADSITLSANNTIITEYNNVDVAIDGTGYGRVTTTYIGTWPSDGFDTIDIEINNLKLYNEGTLVKEVSDMTVDVPNVTDVGVETSQRYQSVDESIDLDTYGFDVVEVYIEPYM